MDKKLNFKARGFVLGNYWGGGSGAYPTIEFEAETKEDLLKQAKTSLTDGSIDSGMGFESLIGAVLSIKKETSIDIDGDEYLNEKLFLESVGEMSDEQVEFLEECVLQIW